MPLKLKLLLLILVSVIWMLPGKGSEQPFPDWKYLSSIPDPIGYAAPFAGTSNDVFVVAGLQERLVREVETLIAVNVI